MFKITQNKGFHMAFKNGWTVSVQFGPGNYGDNYDRSFYDKEPLEPSRTAEIAAWDEENNWYRFDNGDTVQGYQTPEQVLEFMNKIKAL